MKTYDFVIIGAGSAGCNVAHYLQKKGKKVAVIDQEGVAGGGSGAAGAFLSPLPGKANPYNTFVNEALAYSLAFYENFAPHAVVKKGVLRIANANFDDGKLSSSAIESRFVSAERLQTLSPNFRKIDGYFYENAAILNPREVCEELLRGSDFYKQDVKELWFEDGFYLFGEVRAKNIILAQGVLKPLVQTPYIEIAPIFGVKIDIKTSTKVPFNIHKSISISTTKSDGTVAIGATKERHNTAKMECLTSCDKCAFYVNT
ncbi:MAG: FAD-dependent oxidoreductase [Sulfurimonas sp.]|nr:FAD-dependent oxidoreductase [Sulfurimonas sp.]MDD2652506.1 FAD-dependent oxidoreductase [Sulfurimonas sp.]